MTNLRIGILSTGNIARQFAAGVRASQRCTLQAVASRSDESARSFAQAYQVNKPYASYELLLADPAVDAVYIGLPNSMHRQWTLAALDAGKHVLCEKPIASNAAEAREMFAAARSAGRLLIEAFMYRAHPQTIAIVKAVRSGIIGELRLVRSSFCYKTTRIADNIRFQPHLAGGALMDIGCYCIDFSQLIAGQPPQSATACGRLHPSGVDENAAGVMQFDNGVIASFTCAMTSAANNAAYICGTDGYIEIPVPWKPPAGNAQFTVAQGTPPKMDLAKGQTPSGPRVIRVDADRDLYAYEADAFAAAIFGDAPPHMPPETTLANMAILDSLRAQVRATDRESI